MNEHSMVRGTVVDRNTGVGIAGARVEAWDAGGRVKDLVLYARTDDAGRFSMELAEVDRTRLFGDARATLYFRVFEGASEHVLFEGRTQSLWQPDNRHTQVTLRVASGRRVMSLAKHASAVVRGTLADADGALRDIRVRAFDEHLGVLTPLANPVMTDGNGNYRITYDPADVPHGKERPDLVVKAFADEELTELVAESSRRCRAPATAVVDLVKTGDQWRGPSRFSGMLERITALLGALRLENLDAEQRERLACTTGVSRAEVDALVSAYILSASDTFLSHELAYGLLRRGLPPERDAFFLHGITAIKRELRAAIAANEVTQVFARDLEGTIESQWVPAAASWALEPRSGPCGLAEILTAAGVLDTPVRMSFAMAYCRREGTIESFWNNLSVLSAEQKGRVQLAMQWWTLTRGHDTLMQYLKANHTTHPTLESLCALDEMAWDGILADPSVGVPSSVPGENAAEKRTNYRRVLYRTIAAAFPTKTFVARVIGPGSTESAGVQTFFNNNPMFEFGKTRVTRADMTGVDDTAKKRVKAMDRLFKVVPRYEEVKTLIDAGYPSAHAITDGGHDKFINAIKTAVGGGPAAESIYQKACWQASASAVLLGKYGAYSNAVQMAGMQSWNTPSAPDHPLNEIPDWEELFGRAGGCACKHCASVLSASAYLVDLLQWLSRFDSQITKSDGTKWSALDVLIGGPHEDVPGRRPDLKDLELTCKSSHTSLPYIDLTNEILEVAVGTDAENPDPQLASPIRTSFDANELLAGPEIVHPAAHVAAWKALNNAKHPFTLPFDPWAHEANAYLAYLGVSRADIVQALHPEGPESDGYKKALAKARLGIRELGYTLLGNVGATLAIPAWGNAPLEDLRTVPTFMQYAGLAFHELQELLATRYVNGPTGTGALRPLITDPQQPLPQLAISPADSCDVPNMSLPALEDGHLLRIHGFLRLARRTGLSLTDLDRLVAAFPQGPRNTVHGPMLENVTGALALATRLDLPVTDVAAFYANLDTNETYEPKSPYRISFLNRMVDSPDAEAFKDILVGGPVTGTVGDHKVSLQQALSLSSSDFDLLTDGPTLEARLLLPASDTPPDISSQLVVDKTVPLSVDAISRLYRVVRLARALDLSIADFLVLRAHATEVPLGSGATPASTSAFCDMVRDLEAQKMGVTEIQHVLRGFSAEGAGLSPPTATIEALRSGLEKKVDAVVAETGAVEDPDGQRTRALLAALFSQPEAVAIENTLRGAPFVPASLSPLVRYADRDLAGLQALLSGPADPDPPPEASGPPTLSSPEARFSYVSQWLERHIRAERVVTGTLAAFYELPVATVRHLLDTVLASPGPEGGARRALEDFLPARRNDDIEDAPAPKDRQTQTLRVLERHARLVRGTRIAPPLPAGPEGDPAESAGELLWLYPDPQAAAGLHRLPLSPPVPPVAPDFGLAKARDHFGSLVRLARSVALRDQLAGGPDALRRLLSEMPSDPAEAKTLVAELTGWEWATIDDLTGPSGLGIGTAFTLDTLLRLARAVRMVRKLGLSSKDARALRELDPPEPVNLTPTDPEETPNARDLVLLARRAAKAKVSAAEWADVARGVRDPFREKLRDTLLGYLVPKVYDDTTEAFRMLLIDPEMSPCQRTSRVVQATNSVQLFVQQSFLNLDAEVRLPSEAAQEWEHLKSYRLWEANRKVFLYPENWLDPDLRTDKTPLFKAFETKLRQGEITDASAERALETYLNGLDEIARLQAMAVCFDEQTGTTHIVARTRSVPRKWFYRTHTATEGFSHWEAMNLDIDGEGLLLVVENRRVYMFWPVLNVRPAEDQGALSANGVEDEQELIHRFDVHIAWSARMDGAWSPKRLSDSEPAPFQPARGEMGRWGFSPYHIALVRSAPSMSPAQVSISVVVRTGVVSVQQESGPTKLTEYSKIADFALDPCGGGRWETRHRLGKLEDLYWSSSGFLEDPPAGVAYLPEVPTNTDLSSTGFKYSHLYGPPSSSVTVPRPAGPPGVTQDTPVLNASPYPYRLVATFSKTWPYVAYDRMVIEDGKRSLFVRIDRVYPWENLPTSSKAHPGSVSQIPGFDPQTDAGADWAENISILAPINLAERDQVVIDAFDHPFVCDFARALAKDGVSGLLGFRAPTSTTPQFLSTSTQEDYGATAVPDDEVQFDWGDAYSAYNWELFFHVPIFIATRLSAEGRYEEAQKWFHYVFDPTTDATANDGKARRYWKFRPFFENEDIDTIQQGLNGLTLAASTAEVKAMVTPATADPATVHALETQIAAILENPFEPHALARHRTLAYQKAVVMQYIDNVLDWADSLFRRDTLESSHEALSLYLLANDLLGPRPVVVEHREEPAGQTFEDLKAAGLDAFSNAAVAVESIAPAYKPGWICSEEEPHPPKLRPYFCVPQNDVLLGYWDRVADRLFKLRHCLDIDGVARELPLFAPPIDPLLLIKAKQAGVSFDKILDALASPAPLFRFLRLHAKAVEFASQVAGLGQALLSALEKKDGETLVRLRQTHELAVLEAERDTRTLAIQETKETLAGLVRQRQVIERREEFYRTIRDRISQEVEAKSKNDQAQNSTLAAGIAEGVSTLLHAIPDFFAKAGLPPDATIESGGMSLGFAAGTVARGFSTDASMASMASSALQTEAGYIRRRDEWRLQAQLAQRELRQLDKQIAAQEIRVAMAEHELSTLEIRRSQSREVDELLRTKYTGQELFDWMIGEVAAEHYAAYQTAYDMAKKAERAYQLERGDDAKTFIRFGAWDSLKKGLLAGERLLADLRALDAAYLSRSDREREITKHVSLAELAHPTTTPYLVALRDTGRVEDVALPEWLFDADYPGHYFRRLKAVSVTVATVRNATDGVQCEVALLTSKYRKSPLLKNGVYAEEMDGDGDDRFHYNAQAVEALSTSTADDDAGLFQLDLRDEKLLPYEGQGAVSTWAIEIPGEQNRFPLHRISDVVLHLRYTSRDAGAALKGKALDHAKSSNGAGAKIARRVRVVSARAEAPEGWARFLAGETTSPPKHRLEVPVTKAGFLSFFGSSKIRIVSVTVSATFAEKYIPAPPTEPDPPPTPELVFQLTTPGTTPQVLPGSLVLRSGEPHSSPVLLVPVPVLEANEQGQGPWVLTIEPSVEIPEPIPEAIRENGFLLPDALEDLWLTFTYEVAP